MFGGLAAGPGAPGVGFAQEFEDFPRLLAAGRRPAIEGRTVGTIAEWKGKFGWITPDEEIQHPEARMKGGRVYLGQDDVLEMISGVGAHVSFYVYSDGNGLGAMQCVPSESPTALKKITKAAAKMAPKAKAHATPGRKRVSDEQLGGKVKSWRGGFGFVTPSEPVDHPLFTGSLFLHGNDIVGGGKPEVGTAVSFYLYTDPQGLGAEECQLLDKDGVAVGGSPPSSPVAGAAADTSGLLKAKPKAAAVSSDGMMLPTPKAQAKAGVMKATPKASAAVKAVGDADLAKKMADNPDLAKQLSAWMFDPGG